MPRSSNPQPPCLDARLAAAANYVRPGRAAADIGCDHGKLSAWLAGSGRCPRVFACDLRPGPLAKAEKTCAPWADAVECRLGSGLSVLPAVAAGALVYAVSLLLLRTITPDDLRLLKNGPKFEKYLAKKNLLG